MNKALVALVIAGFICWNATAQKTMVRAGGHHKVARLSARKKAVKDTVIQNFKVCKGDNGYAICGEAPRNENSTYREAMHKPVKRPVYEQNKTDVIELRSLAKARDARSPANKPYPETQSGAWVGVNSWNGIW